jgi:hypothetical protein
MIARRAFLARTPFVVKPPEAGSRRWLVSELDKYTGVIVRLRDRTCVTCGARQALQCSLFHSRRFPATRFDLRNCNAMCAACNRRHNHDRAPYTRFMEERYGAEVMVELDELRAGAEKASEEELRRLLERYRRMLRRGRAKVL